MEWLIIWAVMIPVTILMIFVREGPKKYWRLDQPMVFLMAVFFPIPWAVLLVTLFVNALNYDIVLVRKK